MQHQKQLEGRETGTYKPPALALACATLALAILLPALATAGDNGFPLRRTGAFGEGTCEEAGCHVSSGGSVSVEIDVGPYVPGSTQPVKVTVIDPGSTRWGFQMAARRAGDPSLPAGTMAAINRFVAVRCPSDGASPPCEPNELEYATHTSVGGTSIFSVDWTAPNGDVGDVIFTASGLGADGNMSQLGDRTGTATAISLFAPSNQPVLNEGGTVNAASPTGPNRSIAPGGWVTVFGFPLAAPGVFRVANQNDLDERGRLPTELNRVSVEFRPANSLNVFLGRIHFVSPTQVNLQAPDFPVQGNEDIEVQLVFNRNPRNPVNEVRSNVILARNQLIAPALFTLDNSGENDAAAVHVSGQPVAAAGKFQGSVPASPGEVILIFGNAFGRTNPDFEPGEIPDGPAEIVAGVTVEIGGRNLDQRDIIYAGVAPGNAGLYQFNVRVPDLPPGDHAIFIRTGAQVTQPNVFLTIGR